MLYILLTDLPTCFKGRCSNFVQFKCNRPVPGGLHHHRFWSSPGVCSHPATAEEKKDSFRIAESQRRMRGKF